jgi:DNA repair ATPase RecN
MKLAELKSDFHSLIDQINDPELLSQFYDIISQHVNVDNSDWQSLSPKQQQELLDAYESSEDEDNLIPLSVIEAKYKQWPLK